MHKEPIPLLCFRKAAFAALLFTLALGFPPPASAELEEEMDILRMIYKDQDLITPTRSPKPISQVAENVTVIDSEEIEAINAHTLADVLLYVTGVQVDSHGGPGIIANPMIQGSEPRHVRLLVDGVNFNNVGDNFPDISALPVQQIERIEIIKGPASSAWGSSLGGVINIITKNPDTERRFGGMVSASIGERNTGDYRAEISGTSGSLGYYLAGGGLTGDGLTTNTPVHKGDLYAKLLWDATRDARLQFTLGYDNGSRGDGPSGIPDAMMRNNFEYFFSTLSLDYDLTDSVSFDLSGRVSKRRVAIFQENIFPGFSRFTKGDELTAGGSAKLSWRKGPSNLLLGGDYDNSAMDSDSLQDGGKSQIRWAIYANDTFTFGDFSVTPGIRYDHTNTNGDFWSPSLGVTYKLFDRTILRVYAARGFSIPPLAYTFGIDGGNSDLKVEEVWSFSGGVESSVARYLWFKAAYFLHYIRDYIVFDYSLPVPSYVNGGRQKRQGVEAEVRTVPFWNTSLMAGFSFIDARDRDTGEVVRSVPRYIWDVGIDYKNSDIINGSLRGHYIWWNAEKDPVDPSADGKYKAMIWDLNLSRSFYEKGDLSLEAFFTAHNLFNGAQYLVGYFHNPRRWFEGGVRCRF